MDLYDDVLTSSTCIKVENGKEKVSLLASHHHHHHPTSQSGSSSAQHSIGSHNSSQLGISTPLQHQGSSQSKRVQLYVGNLTWV